MCAQLIDKKKINCDVILKQLDMISNINDNNQLYSERIDFKDLLVVLQTTIKFSAKIPRESYRKIILSAFSNVKKNGNINEKKFLSSVKRLESDYLKRPEKSYIMIGSISIKHHEQLTKRCITGTTILFKRILLKRFAEFSDHDYHRCYGYGSKKKPENYTYCLIRVNAKSTEEAFNIALEKLDLLRAIWNFALNHNKYLIFDNGKYTPINSIVTGPLFKLHHPNGKLATQSYRFDPSYDKPIDSFNITKSWKKLCLSEKKFSTYFNKHSYKEFIEEILLKYVQILDETNYEAVYIRLWGLLEFLVNEDDKKRTIKRVVSLYPNESKNYHREILKYLKYSRNKLASGMDLIPFEN